MRGIKFRVWDKFRKKLISNILTIKIDRVTEQPCLIVYTDKKINPHLEIREIDKIYCNEFELMQYTGLKDKNGKEIYEGDIVKFLDTGEEGYEYKEGYEFYNIASVVWSNGRFELDNIYDDNSAVLEMMNNESHEEFIDELTSDCKVIGNIHDNPELLQEVEP